MSTHAGRAKRGCSLPAHACACRGAHSSGSAAGRHPCASTPVEQPGGRRAAAADRRDAALPAPAPRFLCVMAGRRHAGLQVLPHSAVRNPGSLGLVPRNWLRKCTRPQHLLVCRLVLSCNGSLQLATLRSMSRSHGSVRRGVQQRSRRRCMQGVPPGADAAEAGRERGAPRAAAREPWVALAEDLAGRGKGPEQAHAGAAERAHRHLQVRAPLSSFPCRALMRA